MLEATRPVIVFINKKKKKPRLFCSSLRRNKGKDKELDKSENY